MIVARAIAIVASLVLVTAGLTASAVPTYPTKELLSFAPAGGAIRRAWPLGGPSWNGTSGPVGIFGIVEKVVFEPNEQSPERVQVWGAFAYVDGDARGAVAVSAAKRGYLYFRLPSLIPGFIGPSQVDAVKTEWADLKAVAGTGQAVAFGRWGYIGGFGALQPDARPDRPSVILERVPRGGSEIDLRVRAASEAPTIPATYQTNAGIVKLSETGSHAAIVKQLRDGLKR